MKHPHPEEWIPFLFDESEPEAKKRLAEHLKGCPECAEELHGWRKSLHRLDAWPTPRQKRRGMPALKPALNLAAAALLVLGLGVGLGRWFSGTSGAGMSRAALENSLKASLLPELRRQMQQDLGVEWQARFQQLQQETSNNLARVKNEAVEAANTDTAHALQEWIALNRSEREDDQESLVNYLETMRKQHESDFVSLRKDLETVATTTDDRIRAAQLKLLELTASNSGH